MWVRGCAHVRWCGCLCESQKSGSIIFLNHSPALQELTCWLDRLANRLWEPPVSAIHRFLHECWGSVLRISETEAGPTQEVCPELHALFTYRRISRQ